MTSKTSAVILLSVSPLHVEMIAVGTCIPLQMENVCPIQSHLPLPTKEMLMFALYCYMHSSPGQIACSILLHAHSLS